MERLYEIVTHQSKMHHYANGVKFSECEYGVTDKGNVVGYVDDTYHPNIIIDSELKVGSLTQPQLSIDSIQSHYRLYNACIDLAKSLYGGANADQN